MPVQVEELIRRADTMSGSNVNESAALLCVRPQTRADRGTILSQVLATTAGDTLSAAHSLLLNDAWATAPGLDQAIADNTGVALAMAVPAEMYGPRASVASVAVAAGLNGAREAATGVLTIPPKYHYTSAIDSVALAVAGRDSALARFPIAGLAGELTAVARLAALERFNPSQAFASGFFQTTDVAIDLGARLLPPVLGIDPAAWDAVAVAPSVPWLEPGTSWRM